MHCSSDEFLPELGGDTFVWACSEPGAASVGAAPERLLGSLSQAALGSVVWSPAEVGGAGGVRQWSGGAWRAVSAAEGERRAWRAWTEAGGVRAMEREVVARRTMIDARMLAAVSAARGGRAPVGSHVAAWVRNAVGFNDDNLPRRRVMGVHRRTVHNTLVGAGVVADGRQRWAVERIVEWRGGCRNREALV